MDETPRPSESLSLESPAARVEHEIDRVFHYHPNAHTKAMRAGSISPVKVADQYPSGTKMARINARLGVKITNAVGTMACAYVFTIIALISLPSAIKSSNVIIIISWIAQTFLQLVLLSIIMVGQNVQAQAADQRSENTYKDAEAVLHEALEIQHHLESQDSQIADLLAKIDSLEKRLAPSSQTGS
ncbi:MAG TPA: hypothetical protein VMU99_03415 [Acidimicrobiales bacterium]|nr:hypothetical protein [Acidimicrobiales bacterium]